MWHRLYCCDPISAIGLASTLYAAVKGNKSSSVQTQTAPAVVDTGQAAVQAQENQRKKTAIAQGYQSTISAGNSGNTGQLGVHTLLGG